MNKRLAPALAGCLLGALLAASPGLAVEGGVVPGRADPLARATVAVGAVVSQSGAVGLSYCSGVLVSASAVLTAGHCVSGDPLSAVIFAPSGPAGRLTRYRVASVARYPYSVGEESGPYASLPDLTFDTALLRLSRPVTGARIVRLAAPGSAVPGRLRLEGRGLSGGALGVVRATDLYPISVTSSGLIVARTRGALVCKGDSGSPVTSDSFGRPVLFGVASAVITTGRVCGSVVVIAPARPSE